MNTKMKQIALPLVVVIAVLLAFSTPAAADYSGDSPLTIYEHGFLEDGGLIYETVTDGSGYTNLYCTFYLYDEGFNQPSENWRNLTQTIVIDTIPEGATVKMARLYNYVAWSTSDNDMGVSPWYNPGMPAEADIWFNGEKRVCQHGLGDGLANRNSLANPIDYGNGVKQYWDTKGQGYSSKYCDYPSGTFAWDVTDMVTGNGVYTAKITNHDTTPTGVRPGKDPLTSPYRERFVTYGFGLIVVYEDADRADNELEYWIDEGCDLLLNTSKYNVYEPIATTNASFPGYIVEDIEEEDKMRRIYRSAELTTVVVSSDLGNVKKKGRESYNMNYFNGLTPADQIGPSTAVSNKAIGLNYFNVLKWLQPCDNIAYFQDRDLGTGRGDNEVVSNAFLVIEKK